MPCLCYVQHALALFNVQHVFSVGSQESACMQAAACALFTQAAQAAGYEHLAESPVAGQILLRFLC